MEPEKAVRIAIVGAGPAGLLAANRIPHDQSVLFFERNPKPGRKLLLSGSGQCNLTHTGKIEDFPAHYGKNGKFLVPALYEFPPEALMEFFRSRGLELLVREDGKVFPVTLKARDVLSRLLDAAGRERLLTETRVLRVERGSEGFLLETSSPERNAVFTAKKLILTTGGLSYPSTGSTGDGYEIARALGHIIVPPRPALAGIVSPGFHDLAGNSFTLVEAALHRDGKRIAAARGDFLFTHKGVSGPAVLDISRWAEAGDILSVNFLHPEHPEDVFARFPVEMKAHARERTASFLARPPVTRALAAFILSKGEINGDKKLGDLTKREMHYLAESVSRFPVAVEAVEGFDAAMVTAGGVALNEVNPKTLESRIVPGLYFAGEILDVDGDSGGYNLQTAFSTGALAGKNAAL